MTKHPTRGIPTARWAYHGKDGALLGYVLRFDGPDGVNKDFLPLTWSGGAARPGEWRWKSRDVPRPLYGLDRLAARPEVPVIVAVLKRTYDLSWLINAAIAFLGSLAVCRIVPFIRGILSLLRLNSELTEKAILKRNVEEAEEKGEVASLRPFKKPEGYGRVTTRD